MRLWGGTAIARLSDLVRKSGGVSPAKPDPPLSFAEMGTRQAAPASAAAAKQHPSAHRDSARYDLAMQEIGRLIEVAAEGAPFRIATLERLMAEVVQDLVSDDGLLIKALERGGEQIDNPRHMLNTAIFAVKIGQGVGVTDDELPELALAASLHDLGMAIVPARILNKPGGLTDEEWTLVRLHPEKGFRLLQGLGPAYERLANVVLQHQEREDGSGYPRGLKGDEIHEFAKIIGLADTYEALTHPRPYRPQPRSPLEVVKEIIGSERQRFPGHILKGFIRNLSTFPVGSWVRLNTGEMARIAATNPAFPLRPVVEILMDARGERVEPSRRIDLSANTLLYITESSRDPLA